MEKFPKYSIDQGQSGPDDGGYAEAMESGDPERVEFAQAAVMRAEGLRNIPSSHIHEDADASDKEIPNEAAEVLENPIENKTEEKDQLDIFSNENAEIINTEGTEEEIIGKILPLELSDNDFAALPDGVLKAAAKEIAEATSPEDLEYEDIDTYEQHITDIAEYDEKLAVILLNHFEELMSITA